MGLMIVVPFQEKCRNNAYSETGFNTINTSLRICWYNALLNYWGDNTNSGERK